MSQYKLRLLPRARTTPDVGLGVVLRRAVVAGAVVAATAAAGAVSGPFFLDTALDAPGTNLFAQKPDIGGMWVFPYVDMFDGSYWFTNNAPSSPFIGAGNFEVAADGGLKFVPPPGDGTLYSIVMMPGTQPSKPDYYVELVWDAITDNTDWVYGIIAFRAFPGSGWRDEIDSHMMEFDIGANAGEISVWDNEALDSGTNSSQVWTDSSVSGHQVFTIRVEVRGADYKYLVNGATVHSGTLTDPRFLNPGQIYLGFNWSADVGAPLAQRIKKFECGYLPPA